MFLNTQTFVTGPPELLEDTTWCRHPMWRVFEEVTKKHTPAQPQNFRTRSGIVILVFRTIFAVVVIFFIRWVDASIEDLTKALIGRVDALHILGIQGYVLDVGLTTISNKEIEFEDTDTSFSLSQ
jgi:hypothetical protein